MAAAVEQLQSLNPPFTLWIHAQGMQGAWDAPLALREHLRDEEDPEIAEFIAPPRLWLGHDFDPDELTAYSHAYAAQVMAMDESLESLLDALRDSPRAADSLVVLTSPRGYLLGQQGLVGGDALLEDATHVPLLVQYPDQRRAAERIGGLLETRDLHGLLTSPDVEFFPSRDRLRVLAPGERGHRTPAWYLRSVEPGADSVLAGTVELYAKPDDRYEVNDVAGRCREMAEQLMAVLDETARFLASDSNGELAPLAAELCDIHR
jgi:hypothetical protein